VLIFGILLGVLGIGELFILVNPLSGVMGLIGFIVYVFVYTMWLKRSSTWSTSMGAISGAMPPVIGYTAVTNTVDAGAILLFAILFLWQPPHFWSLAIKRVDEYRKAGFQVLPVLKGVKRTTWQMVPYTALLIPTVILLYTGGYAGIYFLVIGLVCSGVWFFQTLQGALSRKLPAKWANVSFMISINYLMIVFLALVLNTTIR
jgi:protoheme IX farnesyltransferase